MLLEKSESKYFFDGFIPRITWTLYNVDNSVKAYEHFKVADIVGQKAAYVRNNGLDDDICKQLIIKALKSMGEANKN